MITKEMQVLGRKQSSSDNKLMICMFQTASNFSWCGFVESYESYEFYSGLNIDCSIWPLAFIIAGRIIAAYHEPPPVIALHSSAS